MAHLEDHLMDWTLLACLLPRNSVKSPLAWGSWTRLLCSQALLIITSDAYELHGLLKCGICCCVLALDLGWESPFPHFTLMLRLLPPLEIVWCATCGYGRRPGHAWAIPLPLPTYQWYERVYCFTCIWVYPLFSPVPFSPHGLGC